MKTLLLLSLLLLPCAASFAQLDTLQYDGMKGAQDGSGTLLAATLFPGESQAVYLTRFITTEKCTLKSLILALSVVKFQLATGDDSLVVFVYEDSNVPPALVNVVKTYKFGLGASGFPNPNIELGNPLSVGRRDSLTVFFNPEIVFAPKRNFLIGITLQAKQQWPLHGGEWNGFTLLAKPNSPNYQFYYRYYVTTDGTGASLSYATSSANVSLFMRAVVLYDKNLPDVKLVANDAPSIPQTSELLQTYPSPFTSQTEISFSLPRQQHADVSVYNTLGQKIATLVNEVLPAGKHTAVFNTNDAQTALVPGMYFVKMTTGSVTHTAHVMLVR